MAIGGRVEHHFNHAFDVTIDCGQCADVHAQAAGDGRTHGCDTELFALDLTGLDHVLRERPRNSPDRAAPCRHQISAPSAMLGRD